MKILCVIDSLCMGGAQRQITGLALGFKGQGHAVSFLLYHHIPFHNPAIEDAGINIKIIDEPNYLKRLFIMRQFIRKGGYDAVLSFLEAPSFICEIASIPRRSWKLVVGERNADPYILKSPKRKIYRWFHFLSDYIVSNSFTNIKLVRSINPLLPRKKFVILYNIIDFNIWKPLTNFSFRKNGKLNLVIAARICKQKNLSGLIEALNLLSKDEQNKISVNWYGENFKKSFTDPYILNSYNKIRTYELEGTIFFHPATPDIISVVQEADAVGLFSLYEGFPNSICEGMACGKPAICSSVSDIPNLLSYDPNLLCDPTQPLSIKQTFSYLINQSDDQLKQLGLRNEMIVKKSINKDEIIKKYLKLFQNGN